MFPKKKVIKRLYRIWTLLCVCGEVELPHKDTQTYTHTHTQRQGEREGERQPHTHTHTHTHTDTDTDTHTHTHTHIHTHVRAHTHTYTLHTHTNTHTHTHIHTHIHTLSRFHSHTHTQTHMYTHTHTLISPAAPTRKFSGLICGFTRVELRCAHECVCECNVSYSRCICWGVRAPLQFTGHTVPAGRLATLTFPVSPQPLTSRCTIGGVCSCK